MNKKARQFSPVNHPYSPPVVPVLNTGATHMITTVATCTATGRELLMEQGCRERIAIENIEENEHKLNNQAMMQRNQERRGSRGSRGNRGSQNQYQDDDYYE